MGLFYWLLIFLWATKTQSQKTSNSNSTHATKESKYHPSVTPSRVQISLSPEYREDQTKRDGEKYAIQQSSNRASWLTFWSVFIYALITFGIFVANKNAADAAEKSARVSYALAREHFGTPNVQLSNWMALVHLHEYTNLAAVILIQNTTLNGEAKSVRIAASVEFRESPPPEGRNGYIFPDSSFRPIANLKPVDPKIDPARNPNQPPDMFGRITVIRSDPTSTDDFRAYKSGKTKIFVYGQITYTDALTEPYGTPFCKWFTAKTIPETSGVTDDFSGGYSDCREFSGK